MALGYHVRTSKGERSGITVYGVQIIERQDDGAEEEVVVVTTSDPNELERIKGQFIDLLTRLS